MPIHKICFSLLSDGSSLSRELQGEWNRQTAKSAATTSTAHLVQSILISNRQT